MKENCKRQIDEKLRVIRFAFLCATIVASIHSCCSPSEAHFITLDHNEFHATGFPRPPLLLPPPIEHYPPQQLPPPLPAPKELTPAEFMVDLTNDLTYRILHYHSILNRNNYAFSPTALVSVLVALYEGSASRSAMELRNVLQLPGNRDVIRVGYRDIHRRLRTYFFGSDNPLKGLSLNKDNVTITKDYETILMFYGYDLGMDMVSSTVAPTTTSATMPTTTDNTTKTDPGETTTEAGTTIITEIEAKEETTTNVNSTNTATTETTTAEIDTTTAPPSATTASSSSTTTEKPTTTTTSTEATTATTEEASTTTETATTDETTTTTTEAAETTTEEATTVAPTAEDNGEAAELVSASSRTVDDAEPLRLKKARVTRLPSSKLQVPLQPPLQIVTTPRTNYLPSARSRAAPSRMGRTRRHIFDFKEVDASLFVTLFSPQPAHHHNVIPIHGPAALAHLTNEYEVDVEPHFLSHSDSKQNYNTDVISHVFYLGDQQIIHTTFKVYNAVLYYKYFDHLKMNVIELELDTPEYNLMILLPDFHTDLVAAAASLKLGPTLRLMRRQLKPRWVQAIIPDFKLNGAMFLTNDLQNMGICDIFEPNRADFRPMTDEKGIYVKHIEQSINVSIRTHPINQLKRNYGAQTQPIQISVNHPFLFFIVDRDLDIAVMAGRILNPLNVRIQ